MQGVDQERRVRFGILGDGHECMEGVRRGGGDGRVGTGAVKREWHVVEI